MNRPFCILTGRLLPALSYNLTRFRPIRVYTGFMGDYTDSPAPQADSQATPRLQLVPISIGQFL